MQNQHNQQWPQVRPKSSRHFVDDILTVFHLEAKTPQELLQTVPFNLVFRDEDGADVKTDTVLSKDLTPKYTTPLSELREKGNLYIFHTLCTIPYHLLYNLFSTWSQIAEIPLLFSRWYQRDPGKHSANDIHPIDAEGAYFIFVWLNAVLSSTHPGPERHRAETSRWSAYGCVARFVL